MGFLNTAASSSGVGRCPGKGRFSKAVGNISTEKRQIVKGQISTVVEVGRCGCKITQRSEIQKMNKFSCVHETHADVGMDGILGERLQKFGTFVEGFVFTYSLGLCQSCSGLILGGGRM